MSFPTQVYPTDGSKGYQAGGGGGYPNAQYPGAPPPAYAYPQPGYGNNPGYNPGYNPSPVAAYPAIPNSPYSMAGSPQPLLQNHSPYNNYPPQVTVAGYPPSAPATAAPHPAPPPPPGPSPASVRFRRYFGMLAAFLAVGIVCLVTTPSTKVVSYSPGNGEKNFFSFMSTIWNSTGVTEMRSVAGVVVRHRESNFTFNLQRNSWGSDNSVFYNNNGLSSFTQFNQADYPPLIKWSTFMDWNSMNNQSISSFDVSIIDITGGSTNFTIRSVRQNYVASRYLCAVPSASCAQNCQVNLNGVLVGSYCQQKWSLDSLCFRVRRDQTTGAFAIARPTFPIDNTNSPGCYYGDYVGQLDPNSPNVIKSLTNYTLQQKTGILSPDVSSGFLFELRHESDPSSMLNLLSSGLDFFLPVGVSKNTFFSSVTGIIGTVSLIIAVMLFIFLCSSCCNGGRIGYGTYYSNQPYYGGYGYGHGGYGGGTNLVVINEGGGHHNHGNHHENHHNGGGGGGGNHHSDAFVSSGGGGGGGASIGFDSYSPGTGSGNADASIS